MKKILVTGASGFIGRYVIEALQARGSYDIHAVSQRDLPAGTNVTWHMADILNEGQMQQLIQRVAPNILMHFAWITTHGKYWSSEKNLEWEKASVALMKNFFENNGQRLVMAGTCAEYDWKSGILSEQDTPLIPGTLYGQCKQRLGALVEEYSRQHGYSSAWGRIFFLYGPDEQPARLVPAMINAMLRKERARLTYPQQQRDFLYVKDVADAFVALMESPVQGAVNIASGKTVPLKSIVERIRQQLGNTTEIDYGTIVDPNQPEILTADTHRLNQEVGWIPKYTLENGLSETIAWWQKQSR